MNPSPDISESISELLFAAHENKLSPEQAARLNALLESDPGAISSYLDHAALQSALHHNFHTSITAKLSGDIGRLQQALNNLSNERPHASRNFTRYAAAAAVLFLATILLVFALRPKSPVPTSPMVLSAALDVEWESGSPQIAHNLPATPLTLRHGVARITTSAGAIIVLQAPATIQFTSSSSCTLTAGTLTAHIPPAAVGFSVITPQATITDLGTEFGVYISDNHRTHAEVFTGRIQISTSRSVTQILSAHQAAEIVDNAIAPATLEPLAFLRRDIFPASTPAAAANPGYARWLAFSTQLRNLPETIAYYPFDPQPDSPDVLINRAVSSLHHDDGVIDHALWSAGRFPEKSALSFDGDLSRVRVTIPDKLTGFTLAAWINPDELNRRPVLNGKEPQFSSLLASDGSQPPFIYWMIYRGTRPVLRLAPTNPTSVGSRRYDSPNMIQPPEVLHRWSLLAVTLNPVTKQVTHFLNGKPIGMNPLVEEDPSASFGEAQIGGYDPFNGSDPSVLRPFKGSIDELAVISRPLTSQEIQAMYLAGSIDQ